MMINNMVIIRNNIHYIYKYYKLNYGPIIDSSLSATCYYLFYMFYKNAIHAQIFKDPNKYVPVMTSNFST